MSRIAIVRPATKTLPYTITLLGGPDALAAWKIDQANREALYQENKSRQRVIRAANAILMVQEQLSTVKFTPEERGEIATLALRARVSAITSMYGVHNTGAALTELKEFIPTKTFWQKCQDTAARIWRDAFDSDN